MGVLSARVDVHVVPYSPHLLPYRVVSSSKVSGFKNEIFVPANI